MDTLHPSSLPCAMYVYKMEMQVCGDLESPEGAEEVEMATSGATLTMLDKAVLGGVR